MNDFEWQEAYQAGRQNGWKEAIAYLTQGTIPVEGPPEGHSHKMVNANLGNKK